MKRASFVALPLVVFMVVTAALALVASSPSRVIHIEASGPQYALADLMARADLIALVRPTGQRSEHWNNASNTEWSAPAQSGVVPLIVGDESVAVVKIYKGDSPSGATLSLRTIGGTADGVRMIFADLERLDRGVEHIVFLEEVDWPTAEGSERVLAPVAEGQGVFVGSLGGPFMNSAALALTPADLTD
jgi:hypothetical protein